MLGLLPIAGSGPTKFWAYPWGHSGPLCHALSLSSSLSMSWTSMRRRRATVPLATSGELAWGGSLWRMSRTFFKCFSFIGASGQNQPNGENTSQSDGRRGSSTARTRTINISHTWTITSHELNARRTTIPPCVSWLCTHHLIAIVYYAMTRGSTDRAVLNSWSVLSTRDGNRTEPELNPMSMSMSIKIY